jgi:predicted small integral membrane protein
MAIRHLKILFVLLISLLCLFYAIQNVVNLEACFAAFAYVAGATDHVAYARSFFPAVTAPTFVWAMLVVVVGLEFTAGLIAAKGAWDLWAARGASAAEFNGAKTFGLVGCGLAIVIWFGLFGVFGGALFQMWQTEVGGNSMDDAFQFSTTAALIFLIVNAADADAPAS